MSDTSRQVTHRRLRSSGPLTTAPIAVSAERSPANRVEALRRMVAAGQYHVNTRALALRICRVAGVPIEE